MQKFEFKYNRQILFYLLLMPLMLLMVLIGNGLNSLGISATPIAIILGIVLVAAIVPLVFLVRAKGYGILHKNHVEINLGRKKHEVEYSRIDEIRKTGGLTNQWLTVKIIGGRNIYLSIWENEGLEQFMKSLQKRASIAKK